jgi:hypothetical protein
MQCQIVIQARARAGVSSNQYYHHTPLQVPPLSAAARVSGLLASCSCCPLSCWSSFRLSVSPTPTPAAPANRAMSHSLGLVCVSSTDDSCRRWLTDQCGTTHVQPFPKISISASLPPPIICLALPEDGMGIQQHSAFSIQHYSGTVWTRFFVFIAGICGIYAPRIHRIATSVPPLGATPSPIGPGWTDGAQHQRAYRGAALSLFVSGA